MVSSSRVQMFEGPDKPSNGVLSSVLFPAGVVSVLLLSAVGPRMSLSAASAVLARSAPPTTQASARASLMWRRGLMAAPHLPLRPAADIYGASPPTGP